MSSIEAARGLAVIAALALAAPAAATSGSSVQPGWLWPVLLAGVVVGLAVVALRGAASQERGGRRG